MICYLCLEDKKLRKSHSIPNSVFRQLKKQSIISSVLIRLDAQGDSLVKQTQNTFDCELLCAECEQHLGKLEKVFLEFIRSQKNKNKLGKYLVIESDCLDIIKIVICSIFWRMFYAKRVYQEFDFVHLSKEYAETIRLSILSKDINRLQNIDVNIYPVRDKIHDMKQCVGFFPSDCKSFYYLLIEGFLIEIFNPKNLGKIKNSKNKVTTVEIDPRKDQKLVQIFYQPHVKLKNGLFPQKILKQFNS
ncbi:hypothetical protein [Acinetobacter sp. ANC 4648]|uniref:hypothetical protein n=1 Tax=Acinetobacter sp. ANC 4648 TaxID=1977875 RepID=UPI000A32DF37|nr:hypothetical protein [Acinetobacter sp. ANC 4648]OTG83671.1 hypothetical protein B9T27_03935 [Acinetobacter sp. ANC 4648]